MLVDLRWVVLVLAVAASALLVFKQERWATPITVGVSVAGLLYILFSLQGDRL